MSGMLIWVLICSSCGLSMSGPGIGSFAVVFNTIFWLPFAYSLIIVLLVVTFGLPVVAGICRLFATILCSVAHPIDALRAVKHNWIDAAIRDDLLHPGELLPGLDTWRRFERLESLDEM